MPSSLSARVAELEKSTDGICCEPCAGAGRRGYCFHRLPRPFRDLVPRAEVEWHQHVHDVKARELAKP